MKQENKREQMQDRERKLLVLEDFCVVCALLILLLALIFLIDIARYQWILMIILILGVILNLTMAVCAFLRKKAVVMAFSIFLTLFVVGTLIYFLAGQKMINFPV